MRTDDMPHEAPTPAKVAVKRTRPAPARDAAAVKRERLAAMLRDIRTGVTQLSANAEVLRRRLP